MNTHTIERMIVDALRMKARRPGGGLTVTDLATMLGVRDMSIVCTALSVLLNQGTVESFVVDGRMARRLYYLTKGNR